jgi:stress response protein YsnF
MAHPTSPAGPRCGDEDPASTSEELRNDGSCPPAEQVVPLVEETATVGKRVTTERVRVQTVTETVEDFARADVQREIVEVIRVPVDRIIEDAPEIRTEGDLVIVPVVEEVLVVEKRLVLKEELHIRRKVATEGVEVPVTLRKQRAVIERLPPDTSPSKEEITG